MRLRSNHVLPPISEYVPRRRRTTRSASAAGTDAASEITTTAPDTQETVSETQSAGERPAPKRKPAKKAGRKKKAAVKGKKATAAPTSEPDATESQEDPVTLIPSVEQPDTRTLPPKLPRAPPAPPRMFRGRIITAFKWGSASELLKREPEPTPSPPQTPVTYYAWPPGRVYDKLRRIPWSLPWSPPPPWKNWPRRLPMINTPDESPLTPTEEPSRKRNRSSEVDPSPSKRHRLTLQTPPGFENRPRGSSRRTYADRARRREAERNGRIDSTIYRVPELLAQQGEDVRSGNSTPLASHANEETAPRGNHIVPFSSLPSALPPTSNQNQNRTGWGQWFFNSVTGLWRRGNVPQTAEVPQVTEPHRPMGNESSASVTTPSSAPPSSSVMPPRNFESPTPRPRAAERNSRLTASARAPRIGQRKQYDYDLYPRGFDQALLERMRVGESDIAGLEIPNSEEELRAICERESKKRKREPSPDVIPHPPGCSYGFDPAYFEIPDDYVNLPTGKQGPQDTTAKQATVSDAPKEEHVSKRARQVTVSDAPKEEHVSKRARQVTVSDAPEEEDVSERVREDTTTKRPTPSDASEEEHVSKRVHSDNTRLEKFNDQGASQPIEGSGDELRKARQHAEQYKPKTPSRLRAAHRFSTSCNSSIEEDVLRRRKMRKTSLATACPTGDLSQIIWPETESWIERLDLDDPNLHRYLPFAWPSTPDRATGKAAYIENHHRFFMSRLATRRAAQ
ncbi:hypothetical protein N7536_009743 [Penicillium majusculum]|uniref:Uncharacterized protein n=1 Tax=Penicillium solitum TaxID=60172 RepID=A0A1V6R5I8_9EURO|nr:uncharacterized protein PENSOL_c015G02143 [Penicillium solitum]KAJ5687124.1 hypothetical protein N7536_009743 [Penicillium majusculum]OQD96730.1 hypothetical protein PENSOL_c015G02143 [Penicillium solitum]